MCFIDEAFVRKRLSQIYVDLLQASALWKREILQ